MFRDSVLNNMGHRISMVYGFNSSQLAKMKKNIPLTLLP